MEDRQDQQQHPSDRRGPDRRVAPDPAYTGPERRTGDRRSKERVAR